VEVYVDSEGEAWETVGTDTVGLRVGVQLLTVGVHVDVGLRVGGL